MPRRPTGQPRGSGSRLDSLDSLDSLAMGGRGVGGDVIEMFVQQGGRLRGGNTFGDVSTRGELGRGGRGPGR